MNLLILESHEKFGNKFHLSSRKKEHIISIWKAKTGDTFEAGFLNESYGQIKIFDLSKESVIVEYTPTEPRKISTPRIHLYSAFQRPQTIKKILQLCATCGIEKIFFFPFDKSEKAYETSSLWKDKTYEKELILGLEQGKRVELPEVSWSFQSKEKLKLNFPKPTFLLDLEGNYIFHYKTVLAKEQKELGLVLGPESGLTELDRNFFLSQGAYPLKLSKNILRSEFALAFALSQIEVVLEEKNEFYFKNLK